MNANELMIGDWVYAKVQVDDTGTEPVFERTPKRVTDLTKGINGIYVEGTSTFAGAEIEPIPLTAEILEKNGFNRVGYRYGCYRLSEQRDDVWFAINEYYYMGFDDTSVVFSCTFVHELQHALRLAGINKEIVL